MFPGVQRYELFFIGQESFALVPGNGYFCNKYYFMKKFIFTLAALALLASCDKTDSDDSGTSSKKMRYVKSITSTCIQNVPNSPTLATRTIEFEYDNQNRVVKYTKKYDAHPNDYTVNEYDYTTKKGSILVTSWYSPTVKGNPMELTLGDDGLVNCILLADTYNYPVERKNGYITSMGLPPKEGFTFEYDKDWALVVYDEPGKNGRVFTYERQIPAFDCINIDLNWLLLTDFPNDMISCVLWGEFGRVGSLLLEQYPWDDNVEIPSEYPDWTPGRHLAEVFHSNLGDTANMSVQYDADGYPTQLTYSLNVDEYKHSYYYDVDSNGIITMDPSTETNGKTGKVLGTNDFVITITYRD